MLTLIDGKILKRFNLKQINLIIVVENMLLNVELYFSTQWWDLIMLSFGFLHFCCAISLRLPRYNLAGFIIQTLPSQSLILQQLACTAVSPVQSRLLINPLDLLLSSLALTLYVAWKVGTNTTKKSQMIYLIDWSIDLSSIRGPWSGDGDI